MKKILVLLVLALCPLLSACGFQPIYATPEGKSNHALLRQIKIASIISTRDAGEGNLAVQPILRRALENRLLVGSAISEEYDLVVEVTPRARQLAVQIDASVTRFNYQLISRYRLIHRETGAVIGGTPLAIASFNQVISQYSSLFAEREAVEKASTRLAEEIERDILLQADDLEKRIARARAQGLKPAEDVDKFETPEQDSPFDPDFDPDLIPSR